MRGKVSGAEKKGDLKREVAFGLRLLCTGIRHEGEGFRKGGGGGLKRKVAVLSEVTLHENTS